MVENDVELIDTPNCDKFLYSKLVLVKEVEVPIQQVIINGVEQIITGKGFALVCPTCGQKIMDLPKSMTYLDAVKSLISSNKEDLNKVIYCQSCGQKLKLLREETISL